MSTSDGANSENLKKQSVTTEVSKRRVSAQDIEYVAPKFGFRGFQRVPMVVLPRYDITPYFHIINNSIPSENLRVKDDCDISLHATRFSQRCAVKLLKEDLAALKRASHLQEPSIDSSDSDSDQDPAMAHIKCKICEKGYSSERKLQKHQVNKHMIVYQQDSKPPKRVSFSDHVIIHELKEYHKCRKCPKIFEDYKILKTHMKQQHKKRKCYICNYCNKKFIDRIFFKVHIRLHCDVCGLLLSNKQKYIEHKRNICRVLKLHKCKICEESFFNFMDLKDHSYEHISTSFICDICKDQFETKCAIAHHISFLHSKKRPTSLYNMLNLGSERLYLCNFCEESSVERDIIEKHTVLLPDLTSRAMTGYKDYYFCNQCMKKFATETDMLQHKWTHFLKDSENNQLRPKSILSNKEQSIKMTYGINEKIPDHMKPVVILEKIIISGKELKDFIPFVNVKSFDVNNGEIKKPVGHPKSRNTIVSKYQCQNCSKYFSSNYSLNRHIETQHSDYDTLRCKVCEEIFVWPSLLRSHKCIRLQHPELPFEDARPEIHFDNLHEITQTSFDDLIINENDDYMNAIDFEIPAPIVEVTEFDGYTAGQDKGIGYKLVMQEVPIEF